MWILHPHLSLSLLLLESLNSIFHVAESRLYPWSRQATSTVFFFAFFFPLNSRELNTHEQQDENENENCCVWECVRYGIIIISRQEVRREQVEREKGGNFLLFIQYPFLFFLYFTPIVDFPPPPWFYRFGVRSNITHDWFFFALSSLFLCSVCTRDLNKSVLNDHDDDDDECLAYHFIAGKRGSITAFWYSSSFPLRSQSHVVKFLDERIAEFCFSMMKSTQYAHAICNLLQQATLVIVPSINKKFTTSRDKLTIIIRHSTICFVPCHNTC